MNNAQAVKAGVVWSQMSGDDATGMLDAHDSRNWRNIMVLPNGMFSCDEHLAAEPSQGSELYISSRILFSLEELPGDHR